MIIVDKQELQEELLEQCDMLETKKKSRKHLQIPKHRPQPMQQFEPKVEERYV